MLGYHKNVFLRHISPGLDFGLNGCANYILLTLTPHNVNRWDRNLYGQQTALSMVMPVWDCTDMRNIAYIQVEWQNRTRRRGSGCQCILRTKSRREERDSWGETRHPLRWPPNVVAALAVPGLLLHFRKHKRKYATLLFFVKLNIRMQLIHFRGHFIHFLEVRLWWRMLKMHMNMSWGMSNLWNFFILPFIKSVGVLQSIYESFSVDSSLAELDLIY